MNDAETEEPKAGIALEYDLDESPQKVWRAISIAEFREAWLPGDSLADPEATTVTPGEEVRYKMRDNSPPFLESTVTFRIAPNGSGGTNLRIIHEPDCILVDRMTKAAANNNDPLLMLAA